MSSEFGTSFQIREKKRAAKGDDPIIMVALDKLVPFTPYPFKLYEGETLAKLLNSIRDEGLLTPIVVRPIRNRDGYFEILSGHNRANAVRLLGHSMIEAVIRDDLNDFFAKDFFIESNQQHRSFTDRTTYVTANDKIREIHRLHEIFFKLALKKNESVIIDYSYLTRRISLLENSTAFKLSKEEKMPETITSIDELRKILEELVLSVLHLHYENSLHKIQYDDIELTVNQLVLDILYIKYMVASEMTLNEYCKNHFYYDEDDKGEWKNGLTDSSYSSATYTKDVAYRKMKRLQQDFVRNIIIPAKNSLQKYIQFDDYIEFIENSKRKPKAVWDYLWYLYNLPVVKSHIRTARGDSEKEQESFLDELIKYEKFVQTVFTPKEGDNEDYFTKSMGLYHLESISMVESVNRYLKKNSVFDEGHMYDAMEIEDKVLSSEEVILPYLNKQGDTLRVRYKKKSKYYRAPFLTPYNGLIDRAQVLEIFTHYFEFESDDYDEISDFIRREYRILENFYDRNKIWNDFKALTREQEKFIKKMSKIFNALFDEISVEILNSMYDEYIEDEEEKENEYYKLMLGMDRVTFEETLSLLRKDTKKSRHKGGKKSQLSDRKQLLIAIECKRSHRSMDGIAKKYGVSKTRISEVNKRVSEILKEKSE